MRNLQSISLEAFLNHKHVYTGKDSLRLGRKQLLGVQGQGVARELDRDSGGHTALGDLVVTCQSEETLLNTLNFHLRPQEGHTLWIGLP